jgi:hypothetical protein
MGGADTTPPTVTNRTPANGATVSTTTVNIDVTFSEPVVGLDVSDLVLTGVGATSAVKNAPANIGGNTWRFAVSGLQNGPVNVSLAPEANDIEDAAGNDLAATSWAFTVDVSSPQLPPVLSPIPNATIPSSQDVLTVQLSATHPQGKPLSFSATAESLAYVLDQQLGLFTDGDLWQNWGGRNENWLMGNGGQWYFILPNGELYRWDGSGQATGTLVGIPGASYHAQIDQLYNAQPQQPRAALSISGNTLTINRDDGWIGSVVITVTVSDGTLTDSEMFTVFVTS